jgi:PilZ domain
MLNDKRHAQRRSIRYTAWAKLDGEALHGCVLSDISDTGARIDVEASKTLPDRFVLLLSSRGTPRRNCRVVWREPHQIGVTFERQLTETDSNSLVPKLDADAVAALEPAKSE